MLSLGIVGSVILIIQSPYIGALFRNTKETINRIELILLITPHVIRDLQEAIAATDNFRTRVPAAGKQITNQRP